MPTVTQCASPSASATAQGEVVRTLVFRISSGIYWTSGFAGEGGF
ncbi:MAG: hypothetical protein JWQ51_2178 [Tardiphaga sp.]|nr:hypothetical protein [Tardiphaga sp.]